MRVPTTLPTSLRGRRRLASTAPAASCSMCGASCAQVRVYTMSAGCSGWRASVGANYRVSGMLAPVRVRPVTVNPSCHGLCHPSTSPPPPAAICCAAPMSILSHRAQADQLQLRVVRGGGAAAARAARAAAAAARLVCGGAGRGPVALPVLLGAPRTPEPGAAGPAGSGGAHWRDGTHLWHRLLLRCVWAGRRVIAALLLC